jgi:acetoin utilization deacetylase AcuC-like enzyme
VALSIPVTWSDAHRLHAPGKAFWVGAAIDADELPERADRIRAELEAAGARVVDAVPHDDDDALLAVHDAGLVEFLRTAAERWEGEGMPEEAGQPDVVAYIFPTPGLVGGLEAHLPAAASALTGWWCFDTMTPVARGTWEAARGAVDAALTAVDLVLDGAPAAYACCRPPGHHATRTSYGGSCYLNNAAVAAERLRGARFDRVAVLDIDAHHGNGAQSIFRGRDDVLTTSLHVDPAEGWFPHFVGFAEESDAGNLNVTLPDGTGDDRWLAGVDRLVEAAREHRSEAVVLALGVDAALDDPNSPLEVTVDGFREAGRRIGALRLPTVVVQEGGYVLETVGPLVRAALEGLDEGSAS